MSCTTARPGDGRVHGRPGTRHPTASAAGGAPGLEGPARDRVRGAAVGREELETTNEELQTTNEELQSTNEELETINDELRQRTIELNEINNFLEAILTSLNSAVVVVDRDVRIQVWNRHVQELWGLRPDEVEGEHLMNLDIGLPIERLHQPVRACLAGEPAQAMTIPAVNRRGRAITCVVRVTPLLGTDDDVTGVIVLMDPHDGVTGPDGPNTEEEALPTEGPEAPASAPSGEPDGSTDK